MKLSIGQALQKGVVAHKEGNLQEAERLYRSILRVSPAHPDANHNLGLIVVAMNQFAAALPLFKTALEASPKTEQFWLSYIDTLIKEKQFKKAKEALEEGKKQGVDRERLDALEMQVMAATQSGVSKHAKENLTLSARRKKQAENKKNKRAKKQGVRIESPHQEEVNNLLQHYQSGRHGEAEKLAISMTQRFPKHQFGWKALGALLKQRGMQSEALNANKKAVQLDPKDAESHSNLGNTLKELGRLEEAKKSYRKAIELKPDFAEAHYNLGFALQELGRLEEAMASYRKAIELKPDLAEAHRHLALMKTFDNRDEQFFQMQALFLN